MIQVEAEKVLGVPWYYLGRRWVAWTICDGDHFERTYGPMRWTHRGAERALIRELRV